MKKNFSVGDYFFFKLINVDDLVKRRENKNEEKKNNNIIINSDIENSNIKNSNILSDIKNSNIDNSNIFSDIKNSEIKNIKIKDKEKNLLDSNSKKDDFSINTNKKENNDENKITIIYPLSAKIITEEEFNIFNNNFNKNETKNSNKISNNNNNKKFSMNNNYRKRLFSEINNNNNNNNINDYNIKESELKKYLKLSNEEINNEIENTKKLIEIEENDEKFENEIEKYIKLEEKWRIIAQDSIFQLLDIFPTDLNYNKNTIKNVIDSFHINKDLIHYDEENDSFFD